MSMAQVWLQRLRVDGAAAIPLDVLRLPLAERDHGCENVRVDKESRIGFHVFAALASDRSIFSAVGTCLPFSTRLSVSGRMPVRLAKFT